MDGYILHTPSKYINIGQIYPSIAPRGKNWTDISVKSAQRVNKIEKVLIVLKTFLVLPMLNQIDIST